jgi:two-component system phosphate regulon sensor histidine kinase PhoR
MTLTRAARRLAAGDLGVRIRSLARDEIGELSRTLDQLSVSLSQSLSELRDDRDLLGRILESMREGVLVMDGEHRILLANASLKETLLLDSDVVGRTAIEVIRNADLQALVDRAMLSEQAELGEIEIAGMTPRRMQVHASRLSGEPRALLLVLFDVTEMRRLETIRRDFVANVSHELRTPITSIRSSAETLRIAIDNDPKAAAEFLEMIERNARRLGELVNDLLDLSRIEAREYHPLARSVELPPLCVKVIAAFADRAQSRHLKFKTEFPSVPPVAIADPNAVERVLTNLVDNALKYCTEGTTVTLRVEARAKKVILQVMDSGPGIEAKHLPRLFERFYRVDPGRSRDMGGTGLGLSIVKHLVEIMGGDVEVSSEPGKGSTFTVTLPA